MTLRTLLHDVWCFVLGLLKPANPAPSVKATKLKTSKTKRQPRAFTLIEMLTTIAVLIIVLGLMVSLARYVRDRSSQQLTRELLTDLEGQLAEYQKHNAGQLPPIAPILAADAGAADDKILTEAARKNNQQLVRYLRDDYRLQQRSPAGEPDPFDHQPLSIYDQQTLRDAWGSPIVYMPGQHRLIGMAPSTQGQDQPFFFSAGPDRKYLTRDDNLYSYETPKTTQAH